MSEAAAISRSLGGRRHTGRYLVRCPVPGHGRGRGDRRPSLSIADGDHRLLVQCFAGCDARDVLETLQSLGLITEARKSAPPAHDRKHRTRRVNPSTLKTWREAQPIAGTIAETYLIAPRSRSDISANPALRSIPLLSAERPSSSGDDRRGPVAGPAHRGDPGNLSAADGWNEGGGVDTPAHQRRPRCRRSAAGAHIVRPRTRRRHGRCPRRNATHRMPLLGIAWRHRMRRVQIPDQVHESHIFADDDTSGRNAARLTAEHHRAQGRTVVTHYPPKGCKDWGDTTLRPAQEVAA